MKGYRKMKFEEALKQLDELIALLENPDVSLEDSINYYKSGAELINMCRKELEKAELLVTVEETE